MNQSILLDKIDALNLEVSNWGLPVKAKWVSLNSQNTSSSTGVWYIKIPFYIKWKAFKYNTSLTMPLQDILVFDNENNQTQKDYLQKVLINDNLPKKIQEIVVGLFEKAVNPLSKNITDEEVLSLHLLIKTLTDKGFSSQFYFNSMDLAPDFFHGIETWISNFIQKKEVDAVKLALQMEDYHLTFHAARSIKRHIHIHLGPTNSGKTYRAIEALLKSQNGIYLAPLRLLAMEIQERIEETGIPCDLYTGEEYQVRPNSKHISATVEMASTNRHFDVAVIDEVQMLMDFERGWAWTQAILGVAANELHVVGSKNVMECLMELIKLTGDDYTIHHYERKCPLHVFPNIIDDQDLQPGDAVIAFSRKNVLAWAELLRKEGLTVSAIYGALAPEVRRREAARFISGESDVIVSTDAIGMGLNLPIKRLFISEDSKFNGVTRVSLTSSEVQQIGGRAGRYGLHEIGWVGSIYSPFDYRGNPLSVSSLKDKMNNPLPQFRGKLKISPAWSHIEAMSQIIVDSKLPYLLNFFAFKVKINHDLFEVSDISNMCYLSNLVINHVPFLTLKEQFVYACAPSGEKPDEVNYFVQCLMQHKEHNHVGLFELPDWLITQKSFGSLIKDLKLAEAERLSKCLSLYAYLSFKFPEVYTENHKVPEYRMILSDYIDRALLVFKTSKEKKNKSNKNRMEEKLLEIFE
jgi:ATP-dependent RNA helicase SUPV3L1/SUV3